MFTRVLESNIIKITVYLKPARFRQKMVILGLKKKSKLFAP